MIVFEPEVLEVLKKPLIARLSVIDADGYPHSVPLWFDVDGEDLVIISDRKTKKVGYIQNNPKSCITIGGDSVEGTGYLLKGTCHIEEDPDYRWLKQMTYRYEENPQADKDIELWRTTLDMMVIRFKVEKISKVA
jgi:nitroimidazol reductase NimA-like FMN-containing flavoprotein (pyridoxamine 5'-phosphate oxidase superfamily)